MPKGMQSSRKQQEGKRRPSLINNANKSRTTTEWERSEISSGNWRYKGNISCKDGHDKEQKQQGLIRRGKGLTEAEEIKR